MIRGAYPILFTIVSCLGMSACHDPVSCETVGPQLVGPGTISTRSVEHNAALTPDGRTLYFTRTSGRWGRPGGHSLILISRFEDGTWSEPIPSPFSSEYNDADAFVSPDGTEVYFASDRPTPNGESRGFDLWVYSLVDDSNPRLRLLPSTVNSPGDESSPIVLPSGRLYFASTREGGFGRGDLYFADPIGSDFGPPQNLGPAINSRFGEWNLVVDREERILVFEASGRESNLTASGDLYISFRSAGAWSEPMPLALINTPGSDLMPKFSPAGDLLYYSSSQAIDANHTDIFVIGLRQLLG